MRKDNLCTCAGGSWYGLHQYEAMEPKRIMWEHAGNKGTFGNAAYVTLTLMKVRKSKQTDLNSNKSIPARVNYHINNNYCCYAYVKISSSMNNGYLYVNYSHTSNCYSYVKLISEKSIIYYIIKYYYCACSEYSRMDRIYTTEYV